MMRVVGGFLGGGVFMFRRTQGLWNFYCEICCDNLLNFKTVAYHF